MANKTIAEERAEAEALARWEVDQELRAEFSDDQEIYLAYVRADARGVVRVLGAKGIISVRGKGRA